MAPKPQMSCMLCPVLKPCIVVRNRRRLEMFFCVLKLTFAFRKDFSCCSTCFSLDIKIVLLCQESRFSCGEMWFLDLTIRLFAVDFYRVIVDEGEPLINYHAIEIDSE